MVLRTLDKILLLRCWAGFAEAADTTSVSSDCCFDASDYIGIAKRKDDDRSYIVPVCFVSQTGRVTPIKEKEIDGVVICFLFPITVEGSWKKAYSKGEDFSVKKVGDTQYLPSSLLSSVTAPGHLTRISSTMRNVFSMVMSLLSSLYFFLSTHSAFPNAVHPFIRWSLGVQQCLTSPFWSDLYVG